MDLSRPATHEPAPTAAPPPAAQEVFLFPASLAQRRVWFLSQMERQANAYHLVGAFRLRGPLRRDLLALAARELVGRHEALRTTFMIMDGEPVQVVSQEACSPLTVVDLCGLPGLERRATAEKVFNDTAGTPFDLARGPLLRILLIALDAEEQALGYILHHIVADAWSEGILLREVTELYETFAAGRPAALPDLPLQYGDYSQWQRDTLQGETLQELVSYWVQELGDAPFALDLPSDRPRPVAMTYRGGLEWSVWPRDLSESLTALARGQAGTLFTILLTGWGLLLSHLAGQDRVLVGSPVANRNQVELEGVIGLFLDTVVFHVDLRGDPDFRQLLARVGGMVHGAREHQDLPFEQLLSALGAQRDPSRSPIFQVWLNLENVPDGGALFGGMELLPFSLGPQPVKFDLMLTARAVEGRVSVGLAYNADLFDNTTARRCLESFQALLTTAAAEPGRRISSLGLVREAERHQLLVEWNDTLRPAAPAACLHELFAARAMAAAEEVAVICGERRLTFRELDERADRWAARLRHLGVGPDEPVAVLLHRSLDLLPALLGILKAGGAYVPIDPGYPSARIAFVLEDCACRIVLTERSLEEHLLRVDIRVVSIDHPAEDVESCGFRTPVHEDQLAYIIYTSGSTGRPKGVMVSHRGAVSYLRWCLEHYGVDEGNGAPVHSSIGFDLSVTGLFAPLLAGCPVHLLPEGEGVDSLAAALRAGKGFSFVKLTPAHLDLVQRDLPPESLARSAKALILGGEVLYARSLVPWRTHAPATRLINEYGPTETVVGCMFYETGANDSDTGDLSIGRPIARTRIYLLDFRGMPVPPGAVGEICVGGHQVSRGYLRRPELTAARFIPDPWGGEPGARLYRTGDLARCSPDGRLCLLGRTDGQVKIQGFRIEPGEIETVLLKHPGVREAVVVAREETGEKRLVAYVAAASDRMPTAEDLRRFLLESLPEHMVPRSFVPLPALPLNAHGKVDRATLPSPGSGRESLGAPYTPPRDPVEEALAAVWSTVLHVDPIGVHDNFFAIGGDSIRSIQIMALARERGLRMTLQQIASYPTIAGLAGKIRARQTDADETLHTEPFSLLSADDHALLPEGVEDAYPLSGMQTGMLYHIEELAGTPVFHSINSIFLKLVFDPEKFQQAVTHITARHANLRTAFDLTRFSEPLQLVFREPSFPLGWTDLRGLSESRQQQVLKEFWDTEIRRPFDLTHPPQLRFHVHWRSDTTLQFTLTENHAVIDGWSLHTIFSELVTCYNALLLGDPLPELPRLSTTFRDFIALERRAVGSREHREFWERTLENCHLLRVPSRRQRIELPPGKRCLRLDRPLPPDLVESLREVASAEAVSLKSVLLAVHCKVMGFISGTLDVLTGISSHGRPETLDGEKICGLFLNTLPLRLDLGREGTWKEAIHAAHRAQLEMLPYSRYPLSAIQAARGSERLLETSFVYLNFHVMKDAVQAYHLEAAGAGNFIEETNFAIMTAFIQPVGAVGTPGILVLNTTFDLTLMDEEQALQIERYYLAALRALATGPGERHDAVPLLSATEIQELTMDWSGGDAAPSSGSGTVQDLFAAQVARTPDAVCVECEERRLSYREVEIRAHRLAHALRRLGVGPEARVALWLPRSEHIVVTLLGILQAGGAYLPIDPAFPVERIRFLLHDAEVSAVVTLASWCDRLPAGSPPAVAVDVLPAREGDGRLASGGEAGHLAYVLHTSGSTGSAKGVGVEHRQLLAYLRAVRERLDLPADATYAHVSTFAADLGNTVLFPPLCFGGTLRIVPDAQLQDPNLLAEDFARHPVDCLKIVPSQLAAFLEHPQGAVLLPRRRLILGGEALSWKLAETVRRLAPGCRIFNHYGPTETTVGVIAGEIRGSDPETSTAPALGRPLPHARAHVLGPDLQPVPVGTPGELWLGGAAVSRGYMGRPDLTAERFVPAPFASEPGARCYRSGDMARWSAAGELEFLGRRDHQVKIRGFRIELGEIEATLRRHPSIRDAVVLARQEGNSLLLAAYVVPVQGGAVRAEEIRAFLAGSLPSPMLPAAIVELREFPLTANGKVDRRALPAPAQPRSETVMEEPQTPGEVQLLHLWEEILGHGSFGRRSDFFAAGGNSLLALRLIAKLRKQLGQKLPLTTLLEARTVEKLARILESEMPPAAPCHLVPIQPRGERLPLFCVHPGHGSVSSYLALARHLGQDQPFYGLQAQDLDRDGDPYLSVEELAARYLSEVTAVAPRGPYLLAGWSFGGLVAFEMAQQLLRRGEEVPGLLLIDTRTPAANARLVGIEPELMKAYILVENAKNLAKLASRDLPIRPHELVGLDVQEQLDRILAVLDPGTLFPQEIDSEAVRRYLELRIARFRAIQSYEPAPYPGRITLFRATEVFTDTSLEEAAEIFAEAARHPTYRWDEIGRRPIDLRPVSGNHETIIHEPYVRELAERVQELLDELNGSERPTIQ